MYSRAELDRWLALGPATVVAQEYWEAFSGDLWAHGERYAPPRAATREGRHQMTCLLLRKDSG